MQSPCVQICVIDPITKFCIGCGRTGEEITSWVQYSDTERTDIMGTLDQRKARITHSDRRGATRKSANQRRAAAKKS